MSTDTTCPRCGKPVCKPLPHFENAPCLYRDTCEAKDAADPEHCHGHPKSQQHKWKGQRAGGSPSDAGSDEWIEFCAHCGVEKPGENEPMPACADSCNQLVEPHGETCNGAVLVKGNFTDLEGNHVQLQQCEKCKNAELV